MGFKDVVGSNPVKDSDVSFSHICDISSFPSIQRLFQNHQKNNACPISMTCLPAAASDVSCVDCFISDTL